MANDKFTNDFEDEAPRPAPKLPKRKQKGRPSEPGNAPSRKGGEPQLAKAPSPVVVYTLAACFMIPLLGIAIFMAVRQRGIQRGQETAFAAEMDQLLRAPKEGAPPPAKPGRFAEIDVDEKALCSSHHTLWEDMRAATPAKADYIVHVHTIREKVARYTDGSDGIKLTLELTIIDKPTWNVVGRKTFVGSDPPLIVTGRDPYVEKTGAPPDRQEVIAYYRGLVGMK